MIQLGGVDKGPQRRYLPALSLLMLLNSHDKFSRALSEGVKIVIATPGRLLDLMNEGCLNLNKVSYLILDEADRMVIIICSMLNIPVFLVFMVKLKIVLVGFGVRAGHSQDRCAD